MDPLRVPHVQAYISDGRAVVEVRDAELQNMIEDYLTEQCNLEYEYLRPVPAGGTLMVFAPEVSLGTIVAALNALDPSEVDRVFRLNSPNTPGGP